MVKKKPWMVECKEIWKGKKRKTWLTMPAPGARFATKKAAEKMKKHSKKDDLYDPHVRAGSRKYVYRVRRSKRW